MSTLVEGGGVRARAHLLETDRAEGDGNEPDSGTMVPATH